MCQLRLVMSRWTAVAIVVCAVVPLSAAGALQSGKADAATTRADIGSELVPGDAIRLAGTLEEEVPGDYPVDETGKVVLPLLGSRQATGLDPAELKRQIARDYGKQFKNQEVQVSLLRRIRVLGAVKNPGIYHVDATMSVADALALAGGATQDGSTGSIQILRDGKVMRASVDDDMVAAGGIRSGDQITVPERSWLSRNGKFAIGALITAVGIVVAQTISR